MTETKSWSFFLTKASVTSFLTLSFFVGSHFCFKVAQYLCWFAADFLHHSGDQFFGNQIQTRAYHYQFAQGVHPNQCQGHLVIVDPIHDQIQPFANLSHRYHIDFQRPLQFSLISHPKYHHPHIPLRLTFVSPSLDPSMEFGQRLKKNLWPLIGDDFPKGLGSLRQLQICLVVFPKGLCFI